MVEHNYTLVIGNKNLSSWSLRPWLVMKQFDIPFAEKLIRLDVPESRKVLADNSPSGLVPCLHDGGLALHDSLAICEYLAECFPEKNLWPEDMRARAVARMMSAEMHSGFSNIRATWPMEFAREEARVWGGPGVRRDVARLINIWGDALETYGSKSEGPYLFGAFSIADAMFAPVVSRFRTYGPIRVRSLVAEWLDAMWSLPAMKAWGEGARDEIDLGWYS